MMNHTTKEEQLKLENENLRLKLALEKEATKAEYSSGIWLLFPIIGMLIGLANMIIRAWNW